MAVALRQHRPPPAPPRLRRSPLRPQPAPWLAPRPDARQLWLRGVPFPPPAVVPPLPGEPEAMPAPLKHPAAAAHRPPPPLELLLALRVQWFSFAIGPLLPSGAFYPPAPPPPKRRHLPVIHQRGALPAEARAELEQLGVTPTAEERELLETQRPRTRGDCIDGPRPCPWVSCKHHLMLDVHPRTGAIKVNHPGLELEELPETCALDVADRGAAQGAEIGRLLNVAPQRIRQIQVKAERKTRGALSQLAD